RNACAPAAWKGALGRAPTKLAPATPACLPARLLDPKNTHAAMTSTAAAPVAIQRARFEPDAAHSSLPSACTSAVAAASKGSLRFFFRDEDLCGLRAKVFPSRS